MSKFRVEIDMSFNEEKEAIAFLNFIEQIKNKIFEGKYNVDESLALVRKCRYHECFHDEVPPKQCGNYVNVDFASLPKKHETKSKEVIEYKKIDLDTSITSLGV